MLPLLEGAKTDLFKVFKLDFCFFFFLGEISSSLDWLFKESFSLGWKLIWCGQDSWSPFTPYRFVLLLSPLWVLFQDWCSFVTSIDLATRQVWTLFYFGCGSTQLLVGPIPRLMQLLLSLLLTLQHDRCWLCFIITMAGQIWRGMVIVINLQNRIQFSLGTHSQLFLVWLLSWLRHSCHTLWGKTDGRFNNFVLVTLFKYCKNICKWKKYCKNICCIVQIIKIIV